MKRCALLFLALLPAAPLCASPGKARALLERGAAPAALEILRADLVKHPRNPKAKYNYAVGAYSAKMYTSAIDALTPLIASEDPELGLRSQFQLGNAQFRLAEQMMENNAAGAAVRFEEAARRFDYVATQAGEFQALAQDNRTLTHGKAAAVYLQMARAQVVEADQAARVSPEEAFPGWEDSLGLFDKAHKHQPDNAAITTEKQGVENRLARGLYQAAERRLQQGRSQQAASPEHAVELFRQSIGFYERSTGHGHAQGESGAAVARKALGGALLDYAGREVKIAGERLAVSAQAALDSLGKAESALVEAEKLGQEPAAVAAARQPMPDLFYRAYVKRGDEQVTEAAQAAEAGKVADQAASLIDATKSYEQALGYQPGDQATQDKRAAIFLQLSELYERQGRMHLAQAKAKADDEAEGKAEEALASAEKSVQSFTLSIEYNLKNEPARRGLEEARALLEELRKKISRKIARKKSDEMKDAKSIEDLPKDVAIKLLDYRNDRPAMKNPQLFTAPENKPRQDW